jgi:type II secretory pathway pseudopilin PulG
MKPKSPKTGLRAGYSLLEVLLVIACISAVASMALWIVVNGEQSTAAVKLQRDVAAINNALRLHAALGGKVIPNTGEGALAVLKMSAPKDRSHQIAGLREGLIDPRLTGLPSLPETAERAVWNSAAGHFVVATSGSGFRGFYLNPDAELPVEEDASRTATFALASKSNWVWDTNPATRERKGPQNTVATAGGRGVPAGSALDPQPLDLMPPVFSRPTGYYPYGELRNDPFITLTNPNSLNSSDIIYSLDGSTWLTYAGKPLNIPAEFETTFRAYTATRNPNSWQDSPVVRSRVQTVFFSGVSKGDFHTPTGDRGLVSNLLNGLRGPEFTWGSPATALGYTKPNKLDFKGASFDKVGPDEEFKLGTLTYFNGTTLATTNARLVKIDVDLNLSEPALRQTMTFELNLESTPNSARNTEDQNADYVRIGTMASSFQTTIFGKIYYLKLRFGDHGANGFTTIDQFHTHENKTMKGDVYGVLTTTP